MFGVPRSPSATPATAQNQGSGDTEGDRGTPPQHTRNPTFSELSWVVALRSNGPLFWRVWRIKGRGATRAAPAHRARGLLSAFGAGAVVYRTRPCTRGPAKPGSKSPNDLNLAPWQQRRRRIWLLLLSGRIAAPPSKETRIQPRASKANTRAQRGLARAFSLRGLRETATDSGSAPPAPAPSIYAVQLLHAPPPE